MGFEDEVKNRPTEKREIRWLQAAKKHSKRRKAHIEVYGSWNSFEFPTKLDYQGHGLFMCEVDVPIGEEHHYRFLIDDDWEVDDKVSKTFKDGSEFNTLMPIQEEVKEDHDQDHH